MPWQRSPVRRPSVRESEEILNASARRPSYRLIDSQLIASAADEATAPPHQVERFDESGENRKALRAIDQSTGTGGPPIVRPTVGTTDQAVVLLGVVIVGEESHVPDHLMYRHYAHKVIEELAGAGKVIIAGRGPEFRVTGADGRQLHRFERAHGGYVRRRPHSLSDASAPTIPSRSGAAINTPSALSADTGG